MNRKSFYILCAFTLLASCAIDTTVYPPEPQINFQKSTAHIYQNIDEVDTMFYVQLFFDLIDGDGDMGMQVVENPDTLIVPPTNCFIQLHYQQNGEFITDTLFKATDYTIPYLPNEGQDKTLIADVIIDLPYSLSSQLKFPYDTIYYTVKVVDRAMNVSNVINSDTLIYSAI